MITSQLPFALLSDDPKKSTNIFSASTFSSIEEAIFGVFSTEEDMLDVGKFYEVRNRSSYNQNSSYS